MIDIFPPRSENRLAGEYRARNRNLDRESIGLAGSIRRGVESVQVYCDDPHDERDSVGRGFSGFEIVFDRVQFSGYEGGVPDYLDPPAPENLAGHFHDSSEFCEDFLFFCPGQK